MFANELVPGKLESRSVYFRSRREPVAQSLSTQFSRHAARVARSARIDDMSREVNRAPPHGISAVAGRYPGLACFVTHSSFISESLFISFSEHFSQNDEAGRFA